MKKAIAVVAVLGAAMVAYCFFSLPGPVLTPSQHTRIERWLLCHDCPAGELDSVLDMAQDAPAIVVQHLSGILLEGLDPAYLDSTRILLRSAYVRDSLRADSIGVVLPRGRNAVAAHFAGRTDQLARIRSALALGRINTAAADATLDSAATLPLSPRVLQAVQFARDSIP